MSGHDTSDVSQRVLLMMSHFTAIPVLVMTAVYRQPFFFFSILTSVTLSVLMHWCDVSESYGLTGDAYCFGLTQYILIKMDRIVAAQAVQNWGLTGPDWDRTKGQSVWLYITLVGNSVVSLRYGDTWPLVIYGVVALLITQSYRIFMLVNYGKAHNFWVNHFNGWAFFWVVVDTGGAVAFFAVDEGQYYWILHSMWHFLVYTDALFAFWTYFANLSLLVLCRRPPLGQLWPGNFWEVSEYDSADLTIEKRLL